MFDLLAKAKFVDRVAAEPEWKLVHRQSDAAVPAMRTVYERAVRAVVEATPWDEVEARLESARVDIDDLIPWGSVGALALFAPWTRILGDLFMRMGRISSRRLPVFTKRRTLVAGIFDDTNQRAVTWAERNAADLVVAHADVQRIAIRDAVVTGFEQGMPPRVLARDLRRLVGHTGRDARAVIKRRADLQAAGVASARVTIEVDRYAERLLRLRSLNIARTETIRASVQGQLEGWRQNRNARTLSRDLVKEWIVTPDDRLCPICRPLDEVQVDVDGMFDTSVGRVSGPPAHPQCRCALGLNPPRRRTVAPPRPPDLPPRLDLPPAPAPPFPTRLPRPRRVPRVARPRVPPARPPRPRGVAPPGRVVPPSPGPVRPAARVPGRPVPTIPNDSVLRTGRVIASEPYGDPGLNQSSVVTLQEPTTGRTQKVMFKPEAGESFFERGSITNDKFTLARREELAWKIDQALGTDIVPQTHWRNLPGEGKGSMQMFADAVEQQNWTGRALTIEERYKMASLDVLIGNTDRHIKNYMRRPNGVAVAIDHGYSMPNASVRDPGGFRQFRCKPCAGVRDKMPEPLRTRLLANLRATNWEPFMTRLSTLERDAMKWRIQWLDQRLELNDFNTFFADYTGGFGLRLQPGVLPQ